MWPVRAGVVPLLADGSCARAETAADPDAALFTGTAGIFARVSREAYNQRGTGRPLGLPERAAESAPRPTRARALET